MQRFLYLAFAGVLAAATAAQSARRPSDAPEAAAGASDKMVCKSFIRIGTLADRYRTCKTKAEWERERSNLRDTDKAYSCRMNDAYAEPCK
jgi:hypothetical protein